MNYFLEITWHRSISTPWWHNVDPAAADRWLNFCLSAPEIVSVHQSGQDTTQFVSHNVFVSESAYINFRNTAYNNADCLARDAYYQQVGIVPTYRLGPVE